MSDTLSEQTPAPAIKTVGELRESGYQRRAIRQELRLNLLNKLKSQQTLFPGIHGFEETVVPAIENAILCGQDMLFLGERGQAKTRLIRNLPFLLDEWVPELEQSEVRDDPFSPISAFGKTLLAEKGDKAPLTWVHREERYSEKLATPDVSTADLIGDVDPIKVARGRILSDEQTMHFGLLPRTNRGIFCIDELPDLTEKVQVALFNVMEERDVQVKGYRVRLPLDILVVASANPEDYTSRGRIITPLKDRYAAQIRTHYPATRDIELNVVEQEVNLPEIDGIESFIPKFMKNIITEITFQSRISPDVNQASGVSVRLSIANFETLMANAYRRALRLGDEEAVPRISDLAALRSSIQGKVELEYAVSGRPEEEIIENLIKRATKVVFDNTTGNIEELDSIVQAFNQGWMVDVSSMTPNTEFLAGMDKIEGLREVAYRYSEGDSPARLASCIEFILEGLHLSNLLNKKVVDKKTVYSKQ